MVAMEERLAERLDSFPYRHRLRDMMSAPQTAPGDMTMVEAAKRMTERGISSLVVADDPNRPLGIVTERDVLRAAGQGIEILGRLRLRDVMSTPLVTLPQDAFLYRAIGRMDRLGFRHVGVTDERGNLVGVVSARRMLRQRAGELPRLGDRLDEAKTLDELKLARAELSTVARDLIAEGASADEVAQVCSAVYRDLTARAAQLAAIDVEAHHGPAPAPWCVLVLGSGGRGESLLSGDQDNAIVSAGPDEQWYLRVGEKMAALLDAAGLPFCRGGVMASNADWRGGLEHWEKRVQRWLALPKGNAMLNVDIFFDFRCVHGDAALAEVLRESALAEARGSAGFLRQMAEQVSELGPPLGLFDRVKTENGRVDLKKGGLMPLVGAARLMALRFGVAETGTLARLKAVAQKVALSMEDMERLANARALMMRLVLDQQLIDLQAGREPSSRVEFARLTPVWRDELKAALKSLRAIPTMLQDALTATAP